MEISALQLPLELQAAKPNSALATFDAQLLEVARPHGGLIRVGPYADSIPLSYHFGGGGLGRGGLGGVRRGGGGGLLDPNVFGLK